MMFRAAVVLVLCSAVCIADEPPAAEVDAFFKACEAVHDKLVTQAEAELAAAKKQPGSRQKIIDVKRLEQKLATAKNDTAFHIHSLELLRPRIGAIGGPEQERWRVDNVFGQVAIVYTTSLYQSGVERRGNAVLPVYTSKEARFILRGVDLTNVVADGVVTMPPCIWITGTTDEYGLKMFVVEPFDLERAKADRAKKKSASPSSAPRTPGTP